MIVRDASRFNGPAPPHDSRGSLSSLFPAEDHGLPVTELWAIVAKGWRLVVFCTVAGLVGGVLLTLFAEPKYRATVVLNCEHDANRLFEVTSESQTMAIYDPAFLVTQTRLMRSREVAERVIARLNLLGNPEVAPRRSGFFRLLDETTTGISHDVAGAANRIQASVTAATVPQTHPLHP